MPRGKVKNRKKKIVHSWNHKINPEINKQISTGSKVSLVRALSKLGYCSRTRAVELIQQGRVQVNQTVEIALSRWIDLNRDLIQVDGKPITAAE